jgi:hypothetical protein
MPATINSDDGVVSGSAGLKTTGANDGILALQNNGTTNVTVTAAGNVGVGTTSPINILTVQTAATGTTVGSNVIARFQSNATGRDATLQFSDNVTNSATISMLSGAMSFGTNGVQRMQLDASGNLQFNSGYGSVATAYGCRAWVNFNGVGTPAIRASGNVSSITDLSGSGAWRVNLSNPMPDLNGAPMISSDLNASGGLNAFFIQIINASAYDVYTYGVVGGGAGAYRDTASVFFSIFR